jgi:sulfate transport system substrate-binding protein
MRWLAAAVLVCALGCGSRRGPDHLLFAAYSAPREIYHRHILPAFVADFRARAGTALRLDESYQASGTQSRAIVAGFEADVAALALAPDIDRLRAAGLVHHDLADEPDHGVVATTLVVLAVRPGNPKGIRDFADLARPGVEVVTPSPRTSGGAMWNFAAIYGAALRAGGSVADATQLIHDVVRNVTAMDKGARESIATFEQGIGDVAITYESEIAAGLVAGRRYEMVVPPRTIVIETVATVVDVYADEHGTRVAARALVDYLHSPPAQAAFIAGGFRPANPRAPSAPPLLAGAFTIGELGGWGRVKSELFGPAGVYTRAMEGSSQR